MMSVTRRDGGAWSAELPGRWHGPGLIDQVGFGHALREGALLAQAEGGPDLALALCEWDVVRAGVQKGLESHISLKPRQPPTPGSYTCFLTTDMQMWPRPWLQF